VSVVFVYGEVGGGTTPVVPSSSALQHQLLGVDGSVWDLTDPTSGVCLTTEGVLGLLESPVSRFTTTSPSVAGSRFRGSWVQERPITWHVGIRASGVNWVDLSRRFWSALSRTALATWTVTTVDGASRSIQVRLVGTGPYVFGVDPSLTGWASIPVSLVAEDPYWSGPPLSQDWSASGGENFFGGSSGGGYGPPFYISAAQTISTATITNPGDVEAWPVWTAVGPATSVRFGLGGTLVGVDVTLTSGQTLVVDTDPRRQSATIDGVRARGILSPHDFAQIPPGASLPLALSMTGTGTVGVSIVPRYGRAL
jgi:hypothetical protein